MKQALYCNGNFLILTDEIKGTKMKIERKSGQTKFIKDDMKGRFILYDGIKIVVTSMFSKFINENSTGDIIISDPTHDERKSMLDKLFDNTSYAINEELKIKVIREENALKFIQSGIEGYLIIDDHVKILGTKEYKYLFNGLEYKEKDGIYCINIKEIRSKKESCKKIMNRFFSVDE